MAMSPMTEVGKGQVEKTGYSKGYDAGYYRGKSDGRKRRVQLAISNALGAVKDLRLKDEQAGSNYVIIEGKLEECMLRASQF